MNHPLKSLLPFLGMVVVVVLQAVYVALNDGTISLVEALNIVIALLGAVVTYVVPNVAGGLEWLKTLIAAITAGLIVLINALTDVGVTPQTWVMVAIQFFGGLGIVILTNRQAPLHPKLAIAPDDGRPIGQWGSV